MSQYANRGRGRANRNAARPGLLGAAPGMPQPGLLDSLSSRKAQQQQYHSGRQFEQHYEAERVQPKQGLLGSSPFPRQHDPDQNYERQQKSYPESRDYSYDSRDDEYDNEGRGGDRGHGGESSSPIGRLSPEVQRLMQNLGLSKSDMEQLSRLPENELSAGNLAHAIRDLRNRKAAAGHDRRGIVMEQRGRRPSSDDVYDPAEPTDDRGSSQGHYEEESYHEQGQGRDDAFQTFEQKWYSGDAKEEQRNGQGSSILRGSRGPAAKSNPRWREDQPPPMHQQRHRPDQPPPMHQQRRPSPPRPSPPRQAQRKPQRPPPHQPRSGLLDRFAPLHTGDPHDPSTQELDLLAATISKRQMSSQQFRPEERRYREPERYPEPIIQQPPPPPVLPMAPNPSSAMLEAQMKAMQVLQSEAMNRKQAKAIPPLMSIGPGGRGREGRPKKFDNDKFQFTKQEAVEEASKMRMAQGRVLYLRYKAGSTHRILEADVVDLASPFDKVTNILLVQPKNLKDGWYQAFLELEQSDGAAAMLEHFMVRPPTVKGIMVQFQRSNYQTLKLREDQMNRDIDALVQRSKMKRNRPRSVSPVRTRTQAPRKSVEKPKRQRPNSKARDKEDGKVEEKQEKNGQKQKTQKSSSRTPTKRKQPSPSPGKTKISKEDPKKKSEVKTEKEKPESKPKKESKKEGDYVLVDEVGADTNKKEEKGKEDGTKTTEKTEPAGKSKEAAAVVEVKKETESSAKKNEAKLNGASLEAGTSGEDVKDEAEAAKETDEKGKKLRSVVENLEQATNMSEALLKIVQMNSTKAIIADIMDYLSNSLKSLKELQP